jgi:hypothetical protein
MSVLYHTSEKADLNRRDYSFILAIVCMALALVVATVVFKPAPVRGEMISAMTVGL